MNHEKIGRWDKGKEVRRLREWLQSVNYKQEKKNREGLEKLHEDSKTKDNQWKKETGPSMDQFPSFSLPSYLSRISSSFLSIALWWIVNSGEREQSTFTGEENNERRQIGDWKGNGSGDWRGFEWVSWHWWVSPNEWMINVGPSIYWWMMVQARIGNSWKHGRV